MIQSLLVSFLFISSSPFYHLITFLLTLVLIFHRDFTNPNLPTEQKGRPSQVRSVWFFIYLFIYESNLLIDLYEVHSNIHIYFSVSSSVKQPGYGDAGNMYAVPGSGPRAGAKYFKLLWLFCFVLFFELCYFLVY